MELSERTLYRHLEWLRKKDFMQDAMSLVTECLVKEMDLDIREQRLDSTHVFSNMAAWSRRQLFFKITQRFLKQVRRHESTVYWTVDSELRKRYERSDGWIFGETSPMKLQRQGKIYTSEEQLGYDMEKLIRQFSGAPRFINMASYKDMVRVFSEQFVDNNGKAELNPHPGGKLLLNPSDPEAESVYMNYYEYSEPVPEVANHRVLALDRGEKEGFLKVAVTLDDTAATDIILGKYIKHNNACGELVRAAAEDSYKRLIFPSIEREIRSEMTAKAAEDSIKVFASNLRQLLLQPPLKNSVILGLDPGYRTGCKVAVIDSTGKVLDTNVIYCTPGPKTNIELSKKIVKELIQKHGVTTISIGNGTASRETEQFAADLIKEIPQKVSYMVVSEAGASVYSASKLAAEEFPEYDVSLRSAVSIARRLQDPLAELVKIEPKAIGVGQYQHDMPQARMNDALSGVVEDCVNSVGVDLNTASYSLLSYISGINAAVAKNIVAYREENGKFTDRKELLKVPKLGKKAFEQCAGFLRVRDGKNPLDNTAVHPESYAAASSLLNECGFTLADISNGGASGITEKADSLGLDNISSSLGIGVPTLTDIIGELKKPGRDPRDELPPPLLRSGDIMEIKDLKPGMELVGTVRNIIDFGVFVDIGVHEDGLVHISQICSRYIKHPLEAVKVGEVIKVRVLDVDVKRNRISLTMRLDDEAEKAANEKSKPRRDKRNKRNNRENKGFDASKIRNSSFRIKTK